MGTRNLTCVKIDGKIRVAQYGQWDGYPTGQGMTVAKFVQENLLTSKGREQFAFELRKLSWISNADAEATEHEGLSGEAWAEKYPGLNRDTAAEILQLIQDGKISQLVDERKFVKDALFCEWAYCVNMDTQTVTIKTRHWGTEQGYKTVIAFKDLTPALMADLDKQFDSLREKLDAEQRG